jgi:hypothetical protein
MSDWITDRRPTAEDAHDLGYVWVTTEHGNVLRQLWNQIGDRPWMPTARPEPYVKPKRCIVLLHNDGSGLYRVSMKGFGVPAYGIPTREAAERIAAIYEEVMP